MKPLVNRDLAAAPLTAWFLLLGLGWMGLHIPACGERVPASESEKILYIGEGNGLERDPAKHSSSSTTTSWTTTTTSTTTGPITEVFVTGFKDPVALTFDNQGNLYIAQRGKREITKVDTLRTTSTFASGVDCQDVAFDLDFGILVGTTTGVRAYNLNGSLLSTATATSQINFVGPALTLDNSVFVASREDSSARIFKVANFSFTTYLTGSGSGLSNIRDLVADGADNLYAVCSNGTIFKITKTLGITTLTTSLLLPDQTTLFENSLFVAERNGGRIVQVSLSSGGQNILVSGIDSPSGVAISNGYLYWCTGTAENAVVSRVALNQVNGVR